MYSYITLLSSRDYLEGVLVLNHSLLKVRSQYLLTVLIPRELIKGSSEIKEIFLRRKINYHIFNNSFKLPDIVIQKIYSKRWVNTFDKLHVFGLTSYNKVVFLDSDMLVLKNIDHLFEKAHLTFAAASDQVSGYESWNLPNSGMMVIEPEKGLPEKIFEIWPEVQSKKMDFSDQDLIHSYFEENFKKNQEWRVPAIYNCFVFLIDKIIKERKYNFNVTKPDPLTISVLHFAIKDRPWLMNRKDIFKFYISRLFSRKYAEIKAYNLYFNFLNQIKRQNKKT